MSTTACVKKEWPFVASQEVACIWLNALVDASQWLSCIVGNVSIRFYEQSAVLALHSCNTVGLIMESFKKRMDQNRHSRARDFCIPCTLLHFPNLAPSSPTMQLRRWVTPLGAFYRITCSFIRSHKKVLYYIFHMCSGTPTQHNLIGKIGGVTL